MRRAITVTVSLAVGLAVTGCSSGSDESAEPSTSVTTGATVTTAPTTSAPEPTASTTSPTTTSTTSTTSTTTPSTTTAPSTTTTTTTTVSASAGSTVPADLTAAELVERELAGTALVTLDDFPNGWIEAPLEDDADDPLTTRFEERIDTCLGLAGDDPVGDRLDRITASSGEFRPEGSSSPSVEHEVVLAPDVDTAIERMERIDLTGAEGCVGDVVAEFFRTAVAQDPTVDIEVGEVIVTVDDRDTPPDLSTGFRLEIPLTADGDAATQFVELLYQRQGRALSELTFLSFGEPFSRDGYVALSDTVAISLVLVGL